MFNASPGTRGLMNEFFFRCSSGAMELAATTDRSPVVS
jgi:hypothetical protein